MKLSLATEQNKIKALAEMDGWEYDDYRPHHRLFLTSYDAIIPLIQKQDNRVFFHVLAYLGKETLEPIPVLHTIASARAYYKATPQQLADALLMAAGRFEV